MKRNITVPILTIGVMMILGTLMLILAKPAHSGSAERATTYFVEEIWSHAAGITILVFGSILLLVTLINRSKPESPKPASPGAVIFGISFSIFKITVLLYAIMLAQYFLAGYKILPSDLSFGDESMDMIHMVCILFLIVFGITALISWLVTRKSAKKASALTKE